MHKSRDLPISIYDISQIIGTISDPKFQSSLFPNPQIFLHIQEEIHYNKLHGEQFP